VVAAGAKDLQRRKTGTRIHIRTHLLGLLAAGYIHDSELAVI